MNSPRTLLLRVAVTTTPNVLPAGSNCEQVIDDVVASDSSSRIGTVALVPNRDTPSTSGAHPRFKDVRLGSGTAADYTALRHETE